MTKLEISKGCTIQLDFWEKPKRIEGQGALDILLALKHTKSTNGRQKDEQVHKMPIHLDYMQRARSPRARDGVI